MAHYDIFRQQLGMTYPLCGYALWDSYPWEPDTLVRVGDVGFIRRGKFHRLFNALCSESEQSDVALPEDYQQLVPKSSNHISKGSLTRGPYCSTKVDMEDLDIIRSEGPGNSHVSLKCLGKREGAVLFLPVDAQSEDTLAQGDFADWVVKHIDRWFEFAKGRGLGIERMEDIILVTGYHRTKSWMNVAFLGSHDDAQVSLETNIGDSIEFPFSPGGIRGAMLNRGPEGNLKNLPEEGCIFIRGFRVTRTWWSLRKHLKAASSPHPDPEGYDSEPDTELISIPAITKYWDPLHVLIDYITEVSITGFASCPCRTSTLNIYVNDEHADGCDMVLVHDNDLQKINGIGEGIPLESFKPELLMDLLRESNIEIRRGVSPASNPNFDTGGVWVAMVSGLLQDRKYNLELVPSEVFSAQNLDICKTGESPRITASGLYLSELSSARKLDPQVSELSALSYCDQASPSSSKRRSSMQRWKCNLCHKEFAQRQGLTRHQREVHSSNSCPYCSFVWTRPYILKEHLARHHNGLPVVTEAPVPVVEKAVEPGKAHERGESSGQQK